MSGNGSLSGISFSGIGSGIDTDSIVQKLMQIESLPVVRMQTRQVSLNAKLTLYQQLQSKLAALSSAAAAVNVSSAFDPIVATVSDSSVATVSASPNASVGLFNLTVQQLAKVHKIASNSQTSSDAALNLSGDAVIDGKALHIDSTDTLTTIASKINGLGVNVTASIVKGGQGSFYLTLTSKSSGVGNRVQVANVTGTVFQTLGLTDGAKAYRDPVTGGFRSYGFSSASDTLSSLTGSNLSGSFAINGQTVTVDFAQDSLSSVAGKINTAAGGTGVTASVVEVTSGGKTVQKLQVTGSIAGLPTDPDNVLSALGALQEGFSNQVSAGQDAQFTLDGVAMTNGSNSITEAVDGLTITLLKDQTQGSASTTITLDKDTAKIKASMKSYMDAFNGLADYIKQNATFDPKTFQSGPLFGDNVASQTVSLVQGALFQITRSGTYQSLADIGFGLDSDGKLTLDEAGLDKALAADPEAVKKLMVSAGTSQSADIKFISSTPRTQDSSATGFRVNITQLATKAQTVGTFAPTQPNRGGEQLTFAGQAFPTSVTIDIATGASLQAVRDQINQNASLKDKLEASIDGTGHLMIVAKRYGSASDFTVTSNLDAADDTTGIGTTGGTKTAGVDVAGTLNGEPATGTGQYLLGKTGNATTDGLQVLYTGTGTGDVGVIDYSRGLASRMLDAVSGVNDSVNGLLSATTKSIQSEIDDLDQRITDYQALLAIREQTLRQKFLAMETAIAKFQQQQAQMANARLGTG